MLQCPGQTVPCLFGHVQLVRSGQLVQVGLEHGLHLLAGGGGEGGCGLLAEGHRGRGGGHAPDGRRGDSLVLLLQLVLQALVEVGLHGHGRAPAVALIPGGGEAGERERVLSHSDARSTSSLIRTTAWCDLDKLGERTL